MYCLEAVIVRRKVKISYQIKNINWRFSCTKGLCTIQMAFVALKALKWALKGQELASDTLEILLANAYHWNPCWKVDEMSHFWMIVYYIDKSITFLLTYNLPWLQQHFNIFDLIWLLRPPFVMSEACLKFQPITELSYKIAPSRNLALPAQSADSYTCLDW